MVEQVQWQAVLEELQHTYRLSKVYYTHCAAHRLNFCVVKCCSIREISIMMGTADSAVRYFKYSPKCQQYFEECI